jgi:hypothetical protein
MSVARQRSTVPHVLAGEGMNPTQARLTRVENYPSTYRKKLVPPHRDGAVVNEGDFCSAPIKARNLLMNKTYRELTIPNRSNDFRTEVEWRLLLRDTLNDTHLPTALKIPGRLSPAPGSPKREKVASHNLTLTVRGMGGDRTHTSERKIELDRDLTRVIGGGRTMKLDLP